MHALQSIQLRQGTLVYLQMKAQPQAWHQLGPFVGCGHNALFLIANSVHLTLTLALNFVKLAARGFFATHAAVPSCHMRLGSPECPIRGSECVRNRS